MRAKLRKVVKSRKMNISFPARHTCYIKGGRWREAYSHVKQLIASIKT